MLKRIIAKIKNRPLLIDFFSIGFLLGYIFGYSHFSEKVRIHFMDQIIEKAMILKSLFFQFHPNPDFLSDIAAFEAAVIAFLIPLSIEIISKVSERYESEISIRVFEERPSNKFLPLILMTNIILAILLRFFVNSNNGGATWVIVSSWIILLFFMFTALMVLAVIGNIKKFMTDKSFIVNELMSDAKKSIE